MDLSEAKLSPWIGFREYTKLFDIMSKSIWLTEKNGEIVGYQLNVDPEKWGERREEAKTSKQGIVLQECFVFHSLKLFHA